MANVKKALPIVMDDAYWALLARYVVVLNYVALKNGRRRLGVVRAIGAILSSFLQTRAESINKDFWSTFHAIQQESLPRFYGPEHLAAIAGATGVASIGLLAFRPGRNHGPRRFNLRQIQTDAKKALRRTAGGPLDPIPGGTGRPLPIREGSLGALIALGEWATQLLAANRRGAEQPRQSNPRLGASAAPERWWADAAGVPGGTDSPQASDA